MTKMDKYINEDGLVGIVFGYSEYLSEKEIFNKEMVKIVIEKDFKAYLSMFRSSVYDCPMIREMFDCYKVKFLKPGTKFRVLADVDELYVLTEDDLFTA